MAEAKLEELSKVLARMEASLERIEKKLGGSSSGSSSSSGGSDKPFVIEFDKLVANTIQPYVEVCKYPHMVIVDHRASTRDSIATDQYNASNCINDREFPNTISL